MYYYNIINQYVEGDVLDVWYGDDDDDDWAAAAEAASTTAAPMTEWPLSKMMVH